MSILLDKTTRVIVQGITGREGQFHTRNMKAAGTNLVGGVTPGKGGTEVEGLPVFDTVAEAKATTDAEASCIFVPPAGAAARGRSLLDGETAADEVVADLVHGGPRQAGRRHQRAALAGPVGQERVEHGLAVAAAHVGCRAHLDRSGTMPAE